ncbi:MAG TPA: hypothetical protein PK384_12360 [Candidatus Latescibacteria bacterium]|nr:hypothetical protein [Candidatus Latescibacterota bacterium]
MSEKKIDVWITKYAFTKGIFKANAEPCTGSNMVKVGPTDLRWGAYFHKGEWHLTKEAADARVREMAIRRIASLKKSLADVEKIAAEGAKVKPW